MAYHIRPATPTDGEGIATLFMRVWNSMESMLPAGFLDRFDHALQSEKYTARAVDPALVLLVAEADDKIVGMISAKDNKTEPLKYEKQVGAMYVDPAYQGQGIGTALLEALFMVLKDRQARNLMLWCIAHNDKACTFYEQQGARKITGTPLPEEYSAMPHVVYAWDNIPALNVYS